MRRPRPVGRGSVCCGTWAGQSASATPLLRTPAISHMAPRGQPNCTDSGSPRLPKEAFTIRSWSRQPKSPLLGPHQQRRRRYALPRLTRDRTRNSGKAETQVIAPLPRIAPDAGHRPALDCGLAPAAVLVHRQLQRGSILNGPLPYVAVHVTQTELVRGVRANTPCSTKATGLIQVQSPFAIELHGGEVVARFIEGEVMRTFFFRGCPTTTCVFPLQLGFIAQAAKGAVPVRSRPLPLSQAQFPRSGFASSTGSRPAGLPGQSPPPRRCLPAPGKAGPAPARC
jgi:hypothetical protein